MNGEPTKKQKLEIENQPCQTRKQCNPSALTHNANARRIKIGGFILLVATVVSIIYWWVFMRNYVTTDDAYARADSAMVSARVHGTVLKVFVDNDYAVCDRAAPYRT